MGTTFQIESSSYSAFVLFVPFCGYVSLFFCLSS